MRVVEINLINHFRSGFMRESLAGGELVCGGTKLVKTKLIAYNQKMAMSPLQGAVYVEF